MSKAYLMRSVAALATIALTSAGASAQSLTVNSFGGTFETAFIEHVVEPFEAEYGADVTVVTAYSGDALAQIRAQRNSPPYDVAYISGGQEPLAVEEGLFAPIEDSSLTNATSLYDVAATGLADGYGPAIVIGTTGLVYNSELMSEAPTSWNDLGRDDIVQQVMLTDMTNSNGLRGFLMLNQVAGGSLDDIEPGLTSIRNLLDAGAYLITSTPELQQNLAQGAGILGYYNQETAYSLRQAGLPVDFVLPQEGAAGFVITANLVSGSEQQELAQEFIDFQLRPNVQAALAESLGYTPVTADAELPPEVADFVVNGQEEIDQLTFFDANEISVKREEWVAAWNSAISQ